MYIERISITMDDWKKTQKALSPEHKDYIKNRFSIIRFDCRYCLDCGARICYKAQKVQHIEDTTIESLKKLNKIMKEVWQGFGTYRSKMMHECPICGGNRIEWLGEEKYDTGFSIEKIFSTYATKRESIDKNTAQEKAELLLTKCDEGRSISVSGKNIQKDQAEWLKEYINNLITLENNIYSVKNRLSELYFHHIENHRAVLHYAGHIVKEQTEAVASAQEAYQDTLTSYEDFKAKPIVPINVQYPIEPIKPQMETPRFYNKRKVLARNAERTAKYHEVLEKYHREVAQADAYKANREKQAKENREMTLASFEKNIIDAKAKVDTLSIALEETRRLGWNIPSSAMNVEITLLDEIKQAEELLVKLCDARNTLYGYDVIFGKYRNIVALSTFYEYLTAGRCETLEGSAGAYNMYENEYRANLIITKLDEVIDSLEKIKANQYLLYSSMQRINTQLNDLKMTTEEMRFSLDEISYNTKVNAYYSKVNAYYSKVNAELTNSLGYLIALNG